MKPFSLSPQQKTHTRNILFLLLVCLLTYWPLTFGLFSVKNDAIHYFLPYRFAVSEAIRHGEWPFWSPYIYLGNPIYGDMQSGAWNPFVWVFSLLGRYDITLFHAENLLYIFLGATGMYKLVFHLTRETRTALLISTAYMLSGFMLGGQLINWLASAAFLPFVILYYLQLLEQYRWSSAWKTGFFLYLLLVCGYPSFFILIAYLLLLLFIIHVYDRFKKNILIKNISWKKFFSRHALLLLTFTCLSLPAIISYIDLLPYYARGSGATYQESIINSFEWQHLVTLIFPATAGAHDLVTTTDLTCRNIYLGIFTLVLLLSFPPKMNRRNILLLSLIIFSFLFSLGDVTPLRKLCYDFIPLMNSFRHPSQMRLFMILGLLLLAAPGLKAFLQDNISTKNFRKPVFITAVFSFAILLIAVFSFFQSGFSVRATYNTGNFISAIKSEIGNLSFSDAVLICSLVQLFFMGILLLWMWKKRLSVGQFSILWVLNLFIMAQMVLPMSFVSKTHPTAINKVIHASPPGFPVNELNKTIGENSIDAMQHYDISGLALFYNKRIGLSHISYSPSFLLELEPIFNSNTFYNYISAKPVAYIADSVIKTKDTSLLKNISACQFVVCDSFGVAGSCGTWSTASVTELSANHFTIHTSNEADGHLVLIQSYHHYWKAWVDGHPEKIYRANAGFMAIHLSPGNHIIKFSFLPYDTLQMTWVMLGFIIIFLLVSVVLILKNRGYRS